MGALGGSLGLKDLSPVGSFSASGRAMLFPPSFLSICMKLGEGGCHFPVRMMKSTRWVALWGPVLGAWACLPPPVDFLENKTLPYTAAPEALKTGVDSVDLFAEQCDMAKEVENSPLRCSSPFASENVSFVFYGLRHLEYLSEAEAHVTENQNPL